MKEQPHSVRVISAAIFDDLKKRFDQPGVEITITSRPHQDRDSFHNAKVRLQFTDGMAGPRYFEINVKEVKGEN